MLDPVVEIRAAAADDVELLVELGAKTFIEAYPSYDPDDMLEHVADTFSTPAIAHALSTPGTRFLIASLDSEPVGYAFLQPGTDVAELAERNAIEINRIYVIQEWVGKGIGSSLMEGGIAAAEEGGYDTIWLGVWTENTAAIRFYERWGFEPVATHPFRFGERIYSDLVMARNIPRLAPSKRKDPQSST